MILFRPEDRDRVRSALLARAEADSRVVAAALVGSEAEGTGDRFSDLDLSFGVDAAVTVEAVLTDWSDVVRDELDGVDLFDLAVGATVYRVFLLPGNLQVDLSFSPETEFGATGSRFRLLFGEAVDKPWTGQPDPRELLGLAVHHALRARFGIERERLWQAEYWVSETRHHTLALACVAHSLGAWHGRTLDRLPESSAAGSKMPLSDMLSGNNCSVHFGTPSLSCERRPTRLAYLAIASTSGLPGW